MAFDASNMALIADGNDKKLYFYSSAADALAAITASGYFDAFHAQLGVGDVILIQDSANAVTTRRVSASSSAAVVLAAMDDQKVHLDVTIPDISTAGQIYTVAPVAGTVSRIWSVIDGAISAADATLTAKINGTAVTGGAITVANAGSAAGDVDSATPTAANVVAAGDALEIETDGASTGTVKCTVVFEITPS